MTESPRWERESQEELRPPRYEPQETTELKLPFESVGESVSATRDSLSRTASRLAGWLHSLDRRPEFDPTAGRDPVAELSSGDEETLPAPPAEAEAGRDEQVRWSDDEHEDEVADAHEEERADERRVAVRFPTAALGYNRQAVEDHIAALEQEIAELREVVEPPASINEEIERLGEQTASILVVAHDKAHETARRAQEQAARSVREAAAHAERITTTAERRLRQLDEETDAVWRERERLLEDVREVSRTLATLADAASERFPAAPEPAAATAAR